MKPSLIRDLTLFSLGISVLIMDRTSLEAVEPCRIRVVDAENGWLVPLVELRTVNQVSFYTDNAGVVAFDLPELMGQEVWLSVEADGYERSPDGFGYRGFRFRPRPGGEEQIAVHRTILAQRFGRLTGAGLFGESQKTGSFLDWKEGGTLGSDSVYCIAYQGRLRWLWGDTLLSRYPLGLFHTPSATTSSKPLESFQPPLRLRFDYFRDAEDRPRNVANLFPKDPGPTWLTALVSLPDHEGREHLVASYAKIEAPLTAYRIGLCEWDEKTENFLPGAILWDRESGRPKPDLLPEGHPTLWIDPADPEGRRWLLLGDPFPRMKVPARYEAWLDSTQWEAISAPEFLLDAEGKEIKVHRGSIAWSPYRRRWTVILCQIGGEPSMLGELWYAEADSPLGPWGTAVKVLSHRKLTFYNPLQHPELLPENAPFLLFEGTYTHTFSPDPRQTPRYDYNQILYRLDLDDPRLSPAQRKHSESLPNPTTRKSGDE